MKKLSINQILKETTDKIKHKVSDYSYSRCLSESKILLSHSLGLERNDLIKMSNKILDEKEYIKFTKMLDEFLVDNKPIEYICKYADFYSLKFI